MVKPRTKKAPLSLSPLKKRPNRDPGLIGEGFITKESIRRMARRGGVRSFREKNSENGGPMYGLYRELVVSEMRRLAQPLPALLEYQRRTNIKPLDVEYVIRLLDGERIYGAQSKND